jgi:glycosyltransferase involved in cell wall biosynthesis
MLAWGYNEEGLVEKFLDQAFSLLDSTVIDYEIIFVNDGSTDQTGPIVDSYANRNDHLKVIHHTSNQNVGAACRNAITAAKQEYLFWQTVDWSYDLKHLRIFLELLRYFDVVQGIRPIPVRPLSTIPFIRSFYRLPSRSDSLRKAIISLGNYYLLRFLFGVPFHDFQNVTFYPTKAIQKILLQGNSSFINPECLFKTYRNGLRYIEVPIPFIPRNKGTGKGTKFSSILGSIVEIFLNWISWGWRIKVKGLRKKDDQIFRIAEPFFLKEEIFGIIGPLFREYGDSPNIHKKNKH